MKISLLAVALAASFSVQLQAQVGTSPRTLTRRIDPLLPPQKPAYRPPGTPAAAPAAPAAPLTAEQLEQRSAEEKKKLDQQTERAEKGSDLAQLNLGIRYLNGDGVDKDPKKARKWLEAAAKQGNAGAKKLLLQHPELPPLDPEPATASASSPAAAAAGTGASASAAEPKAGTKN